MPIILSIAVALLSASGAPKAKAPSGQLWPKDFSSEIVLTDPASGKSTSMTLNVSQAGRARMALGAEGPIVLVDQSKRQMLLLMSETKSYIDQSPAAGQGAKWPGTNFLENACQRGATCKSLGTEKINGRDTDKWEVPLPQGGTAIHWIDREIGMAIRVEGPGSGRMEMINIKVESQAKGLFELPAGYKKMQAPSKPAEPKAP